MVPTVYKLVLTVNPSFLLNSWDLTWLTNLFKNHPIPPFKINTYPSLELRLTNVKQQKGLIAFDYDAPERLSK